MSQPPRVLVSPSCWRPESRLAATALLHHCQLDGLPIHLLSVSSGTVTIEALSNGVTSATSSEEQVVDPGRCISEAVAQLGTLTRIFILVDHKELSSWKEAAKSTKNVTCGLIAEYKGWKPALAQSGACSSSEIASVSIDGTTPLTTLTSSSQPSTSGSGDANTAELPRKRKRSEGNNVNEKKGRGKRKGKEVAGKKNRKKKAAKAAGKGRADKTRTATQQQPSDTQSVVQVPNTSQLLVMFMPPAVPAPQAKPKQLKTKLHKKVYDAKCLPKGRDLLVWMVKVGKDHEFRFEAGTTLTWSDTASHDTWTCEVVLGQDVMLKDNEKGGVFGSVQAWLESRGLKGKPEHKRVKVRAKDGNTGMNLAKLKKIYWKSSTLE